MQFLIANTFQKSLADLTNREQKRVKEKVFDFQINPERPGFEFHRVKQSKSDHFWSARVNDDIRLIYYHRGEVYVVCYVDHHDPAYDWAERRKLAEHPKTGSVQLVEVEERTEEIVQRLYKQKEPSLFDDYDTDYLLRLGVPPEWIDPVQHVGETELLKLVDRLPEEVGERLLALADGEPVPVPEEAAVDNPFEHPDSQRRFHVVESDAELRQALEWPWERWVVFLHPRQRGALEKTYNGPAYVSGGAGTGKTVVAMHQAANLLKENDDADVLLTTFSKTLAGRLGDGMDILLGETNELRERLEIMHLHKVARDLWTEHHDERLDVVSDEELGDLFQNANLAKDYRAQPLDFVRTEWDAIVDSWGVDTWKEYRDFSRTGRGSPLGAKQRFELWEVFKTVRNRLEQQDKVTWSEVFYDCIDIVEETPSLRRPHVVVDEAQDFGPAALRFLNALSGDGQNNLFLAGDSGQRLYKRYFTWSDVGIHVVGRSTRLKINYRTTEQIRDFADGLMPPDLAEHGNTSGGRDAVSLLEGLEPDVRGADTRDEEITQVAEYLETLQDDGFDPKDIAIFGRVNKQVLDQRAERAVELADLPSHRLRTNETERPDAVSIGTMHNAKGLEFPAVIVMGCEQDYLPASWVVDDADDSADKEDLMERERNLLYVACTRARERLLITYSGEPSPFLQE